MYIGPEKYANKNGKIKQTVGPYGPKSSYILDRTNNSYLI